MSGKYSSLPRSVANRKTQPVKILFKNNGPVPLKALWLTFQGGTKQYSIVQPGQCHAQSSYSTHTWILEDDSGTIWATYNGPETLLTVEGPGKFTTQALVAPGKCCDPHWDKYATRATATGFQIKCHTSVDEKAVQTAAQVVSNMMRTAEPGVVQRLRQHEASVAIIGKDQCTGDIPAFWQHRYSGEKKRGFGGNKSNPTCCCAEENVSFLACNTHKSESILVHEVAHSVMNIGFDDSMAGEINRIYQQALASGRYDRTSYCMKNKDEYWAEMTQAWFEATVRRDVTSTLRTRQEIVNREPDLARLMLRVYGDNEWLYPDSAPATLSGPPAPPLQMRRVPLQRLKQQLNSGLGPVPGGNGVFSTSGAGEGGTASAGGLPGLGSLGAMPPVDMDALKGKLKGKMNEFKGFAQTFFKK